jgi:hypothetical protein
MTPRRQPFTSFIVRPLLACLALTAATATLPAQQASRPAPPIVVLAGPSRADIERAERLEVQAEQHAQHVRTWREAASLRLRAARLRGETAEALDGYRRAAWLFSASGDHGAGRSALEQAARVALDRGDPARAIPILVDATLMSHEGRDARQTNRLLQRTRSLLETAVIPEEQRIALRARLDSAARVASR